MKGIVPLTPHGAQKSRPGCEGHHAARGRTALGRGRPTRVTWLGGSYQARSITCFNQPRFIASSAVGPTPSRHPLHETPRCDNLLCTTTANHRHLEAHNALGRRPDQPQLQFSKPASRSSRRCQRASRRPASSLPAGTHSGLNFCGVFAVQLSTVIRGPRHQACQETHARRASPIDLAAPDRHYLLISDAAL
jgi:hypothetical protein